MKYIHEYEALNGRQCFRITRGFENVTVALGCDVDQELADFYQARRDEELGRWRDPQNPDLVCYQRGDDTVYVLDERTGFTYARTRSDIIDGSDQYGIVAKHYFAAHPQPEPKPRPWEEAKVGEIWEIGVLGLGPSACLVTEGDFVEISGRFEVAIGSSLIESGRRIWPEPRIGGAE